MMLQQLGFSDEEQYRLLDYYHKYQTNISALPNKIQADITAKMKNNAAIIVDENFSIIATDETKNSYDPFAALPSILRHTKCM